MSITSTKSEADSRDPHAKPVSLGAIDVFLRLNDVVVVGGLGLLAFWVFRDAMAPSAFAQYFNTILIVMTLAAVLFDLAGVYDDEVRFHPRDVARRLLFAMAVTGGSVLALGFALQMTEDYSRAWAGTWFASSVAGLLGTRLVHWTWMGRMRARGLFQSRVIILGAGEQGRRLADFLTSNKELNIRVVGFTYDDQDEDQAGADASEINGLPVLGAINDLVALIRSEEVDQVIIALPWMAEARLQRIIRKLSQTPVKIRLAPDLAGFAFTNRSYTLLGGLPVLNIVDRPISGTAQFIKSVEDVVLASLFLVLTSPVIAVIAAAVKLDSKGPVFFRQHREGFNNKPILIWKFRTMYADRGEDENITQATKGDPRVTRVGAFLRRTSLDELPQIFNVLDGSMSVVGPRPHAASTRAAGRKFDEIVDRYAARHRVKPGITGWAQVNGWRGETDTEDKIIKRVEHDLYYIDNWSLWFDFTILVRTVWIVLSAKNAY